MFKLSYFILLFLCFASSSLYAQQTEDYEKLKKVLEHRALTHGSIGIAISEQDFNLKVDSLISMIKQDVKFEIPHIILLVRVMNTEFFDFLISEEWKLISNFYYDNFCEFIFSYLNAYEHRRAGVFYSEKYDLFVGGRPHQNSRYRIIKE